MNSLTLQELALNSPAPGTRACGGGSLVTEEGPSVLEPIASFTAVTTRRLPLTPRAYGFPWPQ